MALTAEEARRAAAEILQERRFQPERAPRVLSGPLTWIGKQAERIASPIVWVLTKMKSRGLVFSMWVIVATVGLAAVGAFVLTISRRADRRVLAECGSESPHDQELLAREAFQRGDYTTSVRLQFRAGIRRLALSKAVRTPEHRPNLELSRALSNDSFAGLAHRFDLIAYGNQTATREDAELSHHAWPEVIEQAERAFRQRIGAATHLASRDARKRRGRK